MTFDNFKISVLILALILITLFSFQRNNNRNIQNNNIVYNESNFKFSSKDSVNKLLKQTNLFSNKILKSKLNLKSIEHAILTNKFIEYADVSIFVDGKVEVNIKEKNPVFRVLGKKYYVDDRGEKMPLSNKFSKSVPLILSQIDSVDMLKLADLGKFIEQNKFLKNHITSLEFSNNNLNFGLNHFKYNLLINGFENYEPKFKKYESFFKKVYSSGILDSIDTINLNFKNQVIIQRSLI